MSRTNLVHALCDLFGYRANDFKDQTFSEIWWYLEEPQKTAVKEYVGVNNALRVAGIN